MNRKSYPLHFYADKLENREAFQFVRYGDGEWHAILGHQGQNCDRHVYFPALGEDLRKAVLSDAPYFYALGPKVFSELGNEAREFVAVHQIDREWHDTEVWLNASIEGKLWPLVKAIREYKVLYVGPAHIGPVISRALQAANYITIPEENCYLYKDRILGQAQARIAKGCNLVGFSAGMTTNVLIHQLQQMYPAVTMIDFGSIFDPYAGKFSRSYMAKYDWNRLERANLQGDHNGQPIR